LFRVTLLILTPAVGTIIARNHMRQIDESVKANDALVNTEVKPLPFDIQSQDDFHRLREIWSKQAKTPKLVNLNEGKPIEAGLQHMRLMLSGDESGGGIQVCYDLLDPGTVVPPHYQPYEDELFFVVEGEIELTVGNETKILGKGGFGYAPRNTTHAFRNLTDKPAGMFTLNTPAGHERGFQAAERILNQGGTLSDVMRELGKHDFVFHEENLDLGGHPL
jgi:quercetin dioxygenase-like cupin family protein